MNTAIDFDIDEYKFQSKLSVLELAFAETRQSIGHVEFDLGAYTNKIRGSTVKQTLDLKSEKFPGSQIYMYVNIKLEGDLPEKQKSARGASEVGESTLVGKAASILPIDPSNQVTKINIDINANQAEIEKRQLLNQIQDLDEQKIKVNELNERLKFQKSQAEAENRNDKNTLLKKKIETKNHILKQIEKHNKQEAIILKVLNLINSTEEKKVYFEQSDHVVSQNF